MLKNISKYFLYKSIRGKTGFELIHTFENLYDTIYKDYLVNVMDTSYCYYVVMKDTCDNVGPPGKVACSMVINGKAFEFKNKLQWDNYIGWESGVESYKLFRSDPATPFFQVANVDSSFSFIDDKLNLNEGKFSYYVLANQVKLENNLYFNGIPYIYH